MNQLPPYISPRDFSIHNITQGTTTRASGPAFHGGEGKHFSLNNKQIKTHSLYCFFLIRLKMMWARLLPHSLTRKKRENNQKSLEKFTAAEVFSRPARWNADILFQRRRCSSSEQKESYFSYFFCDPPSSSGNVTRTGWMEKKKKSCVSLYTTKSTNSYTERWGPSVVLYPCKVCIQEHTASACKSPTVYNKQSLAPSPP